MYRRFLDRLFRKQKSVEKIIIYLISIMAAIVVAGIAYPKIDIVPATTEDYEELHEQLLMVEDNPEEFMKHKGKITVYEGKIVYEIENDECEMTGTYSRDHKLMEYSQEDKSISLFVAVLGCIILGLFVFLASFISLYVAIFIVESLIIGIIYVFKRRWMW